MAKPIGTEDPAVGAQPAGKPPGLTSWPPLAQGPAPVAGQVQEFEDLSHHLSPEAREQGFSLRHAPEQDGSGSVHFHGPKGQWLARVHYQGRGTDKPDWAFHVGDQVMKQPRVHTPVVNHLARALRDVFHKPGQFQGLIDEAQGNPQDFDRHLAGAADSLGKAEGKLPGASGKGASWQGRSILDAEHGAELETSAALREFRDRVPREKAEEEVHSEYQRNHHHEAAAHHLKGMKMAQIGGDEEEAHKHAVMYALHLGALGHSPYAEPPGEVKSKMNKPDEKTKGYRYKGHGADSFLLGKNEQINAGYVLRKAWPKDEADNENQRGGFPGGADHQVMEDSLLEQGAQQRVRDPKEVAAEVRVAHDRATGRRHQAYPSPEEDASHASIASAIVANQRQNRRDGEVGGSDEVRWYSTPVPRAVENGFWARIGQAAGIQKNKMEKAWPKDAKDNQNQRGGFPGGADHQVMEDQHLELGGKREEFHPRGSTLWEGLNSHGPGGTRGAWTGAGDIQGGGRRMTQVGPLGIADSDEAEMNRHAVADMADHHPSYGLGERDSTATVDALDPGPNPRPMGPSGLPFGGQIQNEWQQRPSLDPNAITYDSARGDQNASWNRQDMIAGHPAPPSVAKPMAAATKRAEKILASPPVPSSQGVPTPDRAAWAKLKAKLTPKMKKSDEGTGVIAAPKHAITDTRISPTAISPANRVTHLQPAGPAVQGAMPKITPAQPQPGGLVPPRSNAPLVPTTPHPLDLGPGMAGHPRQISAPAIPPVVPVGRLGLSYTPTKKSEQTIGQLLRKAWPKPISPQDRGGTHPMHDPAAAATHAVLGDAIQERGDAREVKPRSVTRRVAQEFRDEGHKAGYDVGSVEGQLPLDRAPTHEEAVNAGIDTGDFGSSGRSAAEDRELAVVDRMQDFVETAGGYTAEDLGNAVGHPDIGAAPRVSRRLGVGNAALELQHPRVDTLGGMAYPEGAEDAVREHLLWSSLRNELKKVRLKKGWPKDEKQNQENRAGFIRESPPTEDRLMEQGLSNKRQHGTSPEIGYPPAAPTEGRGPGTWPTSQGGWKTGAVDRIYEAQASHQPANAREAHDAHDLAMRPGAGGWKRHPGTAVGMAPPPHGARGVFETPRGATPEEDQRLVEKEGAAPRYPGYAGYPGYDPYSVKRQIGIRNDVESNFWQLLGARAGLAAEKHRVSNSRATVKVGKIPADVASKMDEASAKKDK